MKNHNEIITMKKTIPLFLMTFLFFTVADAQAQELYEEDGIFYEDSNCFDETSFYAKFFSGANFVQYTTADGNRANYQTGYIVAGSVGYCWCYGLQLEAEYAYRRNDINKIDFFLEGSSRNGHFQTSSYMGNLLWNLPLSLSGYAFCDIQPFIGAGAGYDFQRMHASNSRVIFDQKWSHFSWQLVAGFSCPIFCNTEMTFEYKYHQGGCQFYNHSVGVGLIYKFGDFGY